MSGLRRKIIGLTGGIGSGKTTAAERFRQLGALVLDADAVSRSLLDVGGGCYQAVVDAFGRDILRPDGTVERKKLAAIVFADPAQRQRLNGIVHPVVIETLLERARDNAARCPDTLTVLDVPLLFECHMEKQLDMTVLVAAPEETRIARIVARDGCTPDQARSRMRSQMPEEEKRRLADVVLDNGGGVASLLCEVDALYARLMADRI